MKAKILVADTQPEEIKAICSELRSADYIVATATSGRHMVERIRNLGPDLVVLDRLLPHSDGLEICKELRKEPVTSSLRVIVIGQQSPEIDRVLALEVGADDYVTRPFSSRELLLRIRKQLENKFGPPSEQSVLRCKEIVVDLDRHVVTVARQRIQLTATEFRLLTTLLRRRGRVHSREQLLEEAWHADEDIDTRTVDTHMRRLRTKLGEAGKYLETVRGTATARWRA